MAAQAARMEAFISATRAWNDAAVSPHRAGHAKDQHKLKPCPLSGSCCFLTQSPCRVLALANISMLARSRGGSAGRFQAPGQRRMAGWTGPALGWACLLLWSPCPHFPLYWPPVFLTLDIHPSADASGLLSRCLTGSTSNSQHPPWALLLGPLSS